MSPNPSRFVESLRARLRRPSPTTLAVLAVFGVALTVRILWVSYVESPFDNIHSDMAGYVNRAHQAAFGYGDPAPIFATLYPPGTHLVYAVEMKLAGWPQKDPMLVLHCLWGAVVAPCALLLALRVVPRLDVAVVVGLATALWYPAISFAGFFSSEQPYAGAIAVATWLLVRQVESGKNAIALGVASSIAYLVRPQIILTLAALALLGLYILWRKPAAAPRLRVGRLFVAGSILTAAVAFGAVRYHSLSGRWGLISDNSAMTRLWADTDYGAVRSSNGYFFESPPKNELGEKHSLYVDGYVGDPVTLDRARREFVAHMSFGERVVRWLGNVRLLFVHNALWPDAMHATGGWRKGWSEGSKSVLLGFICPLALIGIVSGLRRPSVVLVVCIAHVLTMLVVAAFFFAEARYRVPYDLFLFVLALEGEKSIVKWLTGPPKSPTIA
jgi:hypothetical protein